MVHNRVGFRLGLAIINDDCRLLLAQQARGRCADALTRARYDHNLA